MLMSGWTIHSTHGQLDPRECIRFNPCQERQSASWVPFHPTHELFCSCSLQYSEPSLASVLYSLLRVFFFFLFFFFLPFIPSGCSGSSISSVMGSVFSQALSSLVEHPAQTRSHGYSPGEESGKTGNKRRRGEHSPARAGKHRSLRRPGRHCQDQPRGGLCQPLTCGL